MKMKKIEIEDDTIAGDGETFRTEFNDDAITRGFHEELWRIPPHSQTTLSAPLNR